MKVPQMIAAELRRLTSTRMAVIALIALIAVPVLYGGLYLWANQDPYAKLVDIPVALVIDDEGATINGTDRNVGHEVADELVSGGSFQWHVVDDAAATAGLDSGEFDFAVEVPADFSSAIASITSNDPRTAQILLRTNDANNYLASTIGTQAVEKIRTTVAQKIVREGGLTLLDALATVRVNLSNAADGAQQLADGLGTAHDGSSQLASGSTQLADGTAALQSGAAQLASGTGQIADNLVTLSDGAAQVSAGTGQLAGVADRVGAASRDAIALLPQARADIQARLEAAGLTPQQIADVLAALDPVGSKLVDVNQRVQTAVSDIDRLNDGAGQVASGSAQLATGARTAADGAAALSAGATTAAQGAAQLRDGATALDSGLATLQTGAQTLQSGLADGVQQLPDTDEATRQLQASTLANPVDVESSALTKASNYGAGLAPFFAALAGWIGIYALFLIVKPISRRAVTALHSPLRVTLAGWLTPAALGAVQMAALFGVLAVALGFGFANPLGTLGIMVLASFTYAAIILALNVWFGSVGQFLGLVLMVLQLVTAGGTFPWQTLPAPLAALHHVLPMGYVVDAMRQLMYGGDVARVGGDILVLLCWLVGALALAAVGVTRMTHRRTLRDLQPSLIG
ncbi:YhgE/Pip domain-containing protein [Microbacterium rhizomatis]|uniref:YhgE/Pip domain-containing protein n=1 Tax=Microbacterium rhizomatis TaxID=1631477 RepID=A0A5J5IZM9_9MICO|nr:YhgE/Pip domain-containing protein [Microbacterium rhizomatis]KAA9106324.1 YhgE/Pip domain-containing protein [Microbacterium rhizomatis]